jgi:DNA-binding transcriptional LysR family regulator
VLRHPAHASLALAKLEEELGVRLFERNKNEVLVTGAARRSSSRRAVLDEVGRIQHLARGGRTSFRGACAWA